MNIRTKMLLSILMLGMIPSAIIGGFYGLSSEKAVADKVLHVSSLNARQTVSALDDRIQYAEHLLNTSVQDESIMDALESSVSAEGINSWVYEERIANHFNAFVYNNEYVKSVAILPFDGDTRVYGEGVALDQRRQYVKYFLDESFRETEIYQTVKNQSDRAQWALIDMGDDQQICLLKRFSYFLFARPIGIIVFVIEPAMFDDFTGKSSGILTSVIKEAGTSAPFIYEAEEYFQISAELSNGWMYREDIDKEFLFKELWQNRNNVLLFIVFTALIFLFLAYSMSGWIAKRLNILINKFSRLEKGDFTVGNLLPGNDEFNIIEQAYNTTVTRLEQTIKQNYVYQIEKQEAELRALQHQINPHFLYNSLEVINAMAALKQTEDIREVTQRMGKLYRYNMTSNPRETVKFEEEIEHAMNYVYLQNIQMSGRLHVFLNIQPEALPMPVIRFILQPVIENCIKHGFADRTGDCCVEIETSLNASAMIIKVSDDGCGIGEERLKLVRDSMENPLNLPLLKNHVGLINVHRRICLFYGEDCGLEVESMPGDGTTVTMYLRAGRAGKTPALLPQATGGSGGL